MGLLQIVSFIRGLLLKILDNFISQIIINAIIICAFVFYL